MRVKGPVRREQWDEALSRPLDFANAEYLAHGKYCDSLAEKISDYCIERFNERAKELAADEDILYRLTEFGSFLKRLTFYRRIKGMPRSETDASLSEAVDALCEKLRAIYGPDNADTEYFINNMKNNFREDAR